MKETFWIVWREDGKASSKKHEDEQSARDEAAALTRDLGGTSYVMEMVDACEKADVKWASDEKTEPEKAYLPTVWPLDIKPYVPPTPEPWEINQPPAIRYRQPSPYVPGDTWPEWNRGTCGSITYLSNVGGGGHFQ